MSKRRKTPAAVAGPADVLAGRWPWCVENDSALGALPRLPAGAFHVCCTSPPYYALRSYEGVGPASWPAVEYVPMAGLAPVRVPEMLACLGNEPTPEAYVAHLVCIFREVWRVLRDGATLWLNLGDSYAGSWGNYKGQNRGAGKQRPVNVGSLPSPGYDGREAERPATSRPPAGVKPKDLLGIPSRVAFALQADGWHWRQTISWQKLAPMPASVRDRPTSATEDIFLLSKGERYFYDLDACRVPSAEATIERDKYSRVLDDEDEQFAVAHDHEFVSHAEGRNLWNWWDVGEDDAGEQAPKLRWLLGHEGLREKHYAAYPSVIPERAFRLGTSAKGACPDCGAPWRRLVERRPGAVEAPGRPKRTAGMDDGTSTLSLSGNGSKEWAERGTKFSTLGWSPSCDCGRAEAVPCLTLDPFCGSGTSGLVARALGLRFVGVEVSPDYAEMARRRIGGSAPLFDAAQAAEGAGAASLFGGGS